nr:hypothetical protein ZC477.6 - Caenorhabditis elegans [Caenorhabditis elegans]
MFTARFKLFTSDGRTHIENCASKFDECASSVTKAHKFCIIFFERRKFKKEPYVSLNISLNIFTILLITSIYLNVAEFHY